MTCVKYATASVSALLLALLVNLTHAANGQMQSDYATRNVSVSNSNVMTSLTDGGINDDMEVAANHEENLRIGPVSVWLSQLAGSDGRQSSTASLVSSSNLARFIQHVTNRTALCRLLNGTCVVPANCAVLGLTLGYDYGRGTSPDVGKYFTCDTSTICCYPFLLSSLSFPPTRHLDSRDDSDDDYQWAGFETVYEYWYPNSRHQQRRRRKPSSRYSGRRRRYDNDSRRRYRTDRRSPFIRRPLTDSPWNYFAARSAADADSVNYTAVCESRGGMCVKAADCATNSAVDLTGTGSRYTPHLRHHGDGVNGDQIRSFLCNLTAICCLPQPTDKGGLQIAGVGSPQSHQVDVGDFPSVVCALVNGTCLPASQCLTSGFTGALYSRTVNFRCNLTTVCCPD